MRNESTRRNVVQEKSFAFALSIVKLSRRHRTHHTESVLLKQLVRSGTSIGANIEEAIAAQSKKDFLAKMYIALKESRETHYWLRLVRDSDVLEDAPIETLLEDCRGLINLLSSITLTTRQNLQTSTRIQSATGQDSTPHIPHSTLRSQRWP